MRSIISIIFLIHIFKYVSADDVAIQIVKLAHNETDLELVESNLHHLSTLNGPVAIVSMINGGATTTLLSRLLGRKASFGIPSEYSYERRKGIWMWGQPLVYRLDNQDINLVFFRAIGRFGEADAVSTLLSSHLLSVSSKYSLELSLRNVSKLAFMSQLNKSNWTDELNCDILSFPPLTWIHRIDQPETSSDWCRKKFNEASGNSSKQISVFDIFEKVDCMLVDSSSGMDKLKEKLTKLVRPRKFNNTFVTGKELELLLRTLVREFNSVSLNDETDSCPEDTRRNIDRILDSYFSLYIPSGLKLSESLELIGKSVLDDLDQRISIPMKPRVFKAILGLLVTESQRFYREAALEFESNYRYTYANHLSQFNKELNKRKEHYIKMNEDSKLDDIISSVSMYSEEFTDIVKDLQIPTDDAKLIDTLTKEASRIRAAFRRNYERVCGFEKQLFLLDQSLNGTSYEKQQENLRPNKNIVRELLRMAKELIRDLARRILGAFKQSSGSSTDFKNQSSTLEILDDISYKKQQENKEVDKNAARDVLTQAKELAKVVNGDQQVFKELAKTMLLNEKFAHWDNDQKTKMVDKFIKENQDVERIQLKLKDSPSKHGSFLRAINLIP